MIEDGTHSIEDGVSPDVRLEVGSAKRDPNKYLCPY